jgi:fructose-1,6-bisphosphatase/inositol monophosphatase family enzyme
MDMLDELSDYVRMLGKELLRNRPEDDGSRGAGYEFEKRASAEMDRVIEDRFAMFATEHDAVFIGEEICGDSVFDLAASSDRVLIADPIDGTANYLRSKSDRGRFFAVQSVMFQDDEIFVAISYPALGHELVASSDGVFIDGTQIVLSGCSDGPVRVSGSMRSVGVLRSVYPNPQGHGSLAVTFLDLILAASGCYESWMHGYSAYIGADTFVWDIAPLLAVWSILGGAIVHSDGTNIDLSRKFFVRKRIEETYVCSSFETEAQKILRVIEGVK